MLMFPSCGLTAEPSGQIRDPIRVQAQRVGGSRPTIPTSSLRWSCSRSGRCEQVLALVLVLTLAKMRRIISNNRREGVFWSWFWLQAQRSRPRRSQNQHQAQTARYTVRASANSRCQLQMSERRRGARRSEKSAGGIRTQTRNSRITSGSGGFV